jgi:hypothetical protein
LTSANCPLPVANMLARLLFWLLVTLPLLSQAAAPLLQPSEIEYATTVRGVAITTVRTIKPEGDGFSIRQLITALMMKTEETSLFRMAGKLPQPISYSYQRNILGKALRRTTTFDRDGRKASYQEENAPPVSVELKEASYDPLTAHVALQLYLQQHPDSTSLPTVHLLEKNRVREVGYKLVGREAIDTPLGAMETMRVERARSGKEKKTTIWLATQWDYAVVRIEHQQPDEPLYRMEITRGTLGSRAITGTTAQRGTDAR